MTHPAAGAPKSVVPGSPLWFAWLFTPAERRRSVGALLAVRGELIDTALRPSEPSVALARLEWWRGEIAGFGSGREQHPALRALRDTRPGDAVQPEYLEELLDAAAADALRPRWETPEELALYCHRSSGMLHQMLAGLLGMADARNERAVLRYALRLGTGVRLAEVATQARADARSGRMYLPRSPTGISDRDLMELAGGRATAPVIAGVERVAAQALQALAEAERELPGAERPSQRPGLVLASLWRREIAALASARHDPVRFSPPSTLARLAIAWRAARRSQRPSGRER